MSSYNLVHVEGVRTIRTLDCSYPRVFVHYIEYSYHRPFVPWTVRTLDRSCHILFAPNTFRTHSEASQLVTRSTRHAVKSCDKLTVMSDGVVTS